MKYCLTCEMNLGSIELVEKDNETVCPKCETEVIEITSAKLTQLSQDINNAFYNLKETSVQTNAKELIRNAKVIESSEKKLRKEFHKRERQLKALQYEIEVIRKIGEKLNYDFEG